MQGDRCNQRSPAGVNPGEDRRSQTGEREQAESFDQRAGVLRVAVTEGQRAEDESRPQAPTSAPPELTEEEASKDRLFGDRGENTEVGIACLTLGLTRDALQLLARRAVKVYGFLDP